MQQDLLRIDKVAHSDRTIVSLKDDLDLSNSTSLIECLAAVVQERPAHPDVDVSQREYTHFQCRDAGVPLRLLNPNLFVPETLAVIGPEHVLDVVKPTALCGA